VGHNKTVHVALVRELYAKIVQQGADPKQLDEYVGWDKERLKEFDGWIPFAQMQKLLEAGCRLTANPALCLHLGEAMNPENMGIVGHIIMNSETLRQAAYQWERYAKLACDEGNAYHKEQHGQFSYIFNFSDDVPFQVIEHAIVSTLSFCRRFSGQDIIPIEVRFQHSSPLYRKEYERIFRSPVMFNQPDNVMVLKQADMDLPPRRHNSYLQTVLTQHADSLLNQFSVDKQLSDQVQKVIMNHLHEGDVSIETVSREMAMSRWTLNRKLKEEGTSFQVLLEETRKHLATNYLRYQERSPGEVAFLLGFSEPSAFSRAFKRWMGVSPGVYQKSGSLIPGQ
jgi:AraC-like DNA-binding protein